MDALELRLAMSKSDISARCQVALLGLHATRLDTAIGHPADDYDLIWLADGSAVLNVRVWQEMAPPFRHAVFVINLEFEKGHVCSIGSVQRHNFGAEIHGAE